MDNQRSEAVPEEACFACYEAVKTQGRLEGVGRGGVESVIKDSNRWVEKSEKGRNGKEGKEGERTFFFFFFSFFFLFLVPFCFCFFLFFLFFCFFLGGWEKRGQVRVGGQKGGNKVGAGARKGIRKGDQTGSSAMTSVVRCCCDGLRWLPEGESAGQR